jgi:hypothetical protein
MSDVQSRSNQPPEQDSEEVLFKAPPAEAEYEPIPAQPTDEEHVDPPAKRRPPSLFWPLLLIGVGAILLLSNLGYIPWSSWGVLWRLWPLLLVALGVDVLIGRRSLGGAIVSGLLLLVLIGGAVALVFFAQNIPMLADWAGEGEWRMRHIEHPLGEIERAKVTIDWDSPPGALYALEDSNNLIEGDVAHNGELTFEVQEQNGAATVVLDRQFTGVWLGPLEPRPDFEIGWDVRLSPDVPLDLTLDSGSGRCTFDLSGLQVAELVLDSGSGAVDVLLPADHSFQAQIDSGSGALTLILPAGVGARVEIDGGSGAFRPDERFVFVSGERDDDGVWETGNWDTAEHRIEFEIDQGSGRVAIR